MPSVKLVLEYDGGGFSGWAVQPGFRTVEGELTSAVETVLRVPVSLSVAGRTDTGVHAWGQVASFECRDTLDLDKLSRSLNGSLAPEVAVLAAELAPDGFDARHDAVSRTYCYRVLSRSAPSPFERGRALWLHRSVDESTLKQCAQMLEGTHDFTAFTPTQTEHVRFDRDVKRAEWRRTGDVLEFWIEADTFMRHMVRALVGTMLEIEEGKRDTEGLARLLTGAPRSAAGPTAQPYGLYLASVRYPIGAAGSPHPHD